MRPIFITVWTRTRPQLNGLLFPKKSKKALCIITSQRYASWIKYFFGARPVLIVFSFSSSLLQFPIFSIQYKQSAMALSLSLID